MAYYINDYFKLRGYYGDLKKKISELEARLLSVEFAKSFAEAVATCDKKRQQKQVVLGSKLAVAEALASCPGPKLGP